MSKLFDKLTEGGWNVAIRKRTDGLILADQQTPFSLIPNSPRTWEADPFLFEHDDAVYVFSEMFDYITRKGSIGYSRLEGNCWSKWKVVIDEPFHMSYPNVFQIGQDIFMVPETSADNSLRLYQAASFPDQWKLVKVLAQDVKWADTTFWREQDRLFAITRDISNWDAQRDLLLELNDQFDILSITAIQETDPSMSRPGGKFFTSHGTPFRVTQDCSTHYGGALLFSQFDSKELTAQGMTPPVLHLSPENLQLSVQRSWTGLHTYTISEHYEAIDVERRHFHLGGLLVRLLSKFKHL